MRAFILLTVLTSAACGTGQVRPWQYTPRPMADTLAIWEPEEREVPIVYDAGHQFVIRPIAESFTGEGPALNADPMDEVVNSTWFVNRNAVDPLTPEEVRRGPQTTEGPDASGPLTVTSINPQGVTPKFNLEDARGDVYIVKFDPPDYPELASGAEVIATNLFWAAGYYVPENYIFHLDPSQLVLEDDLDATFIEDSLPVAYAVTPEEDERALTMEIFQRHVLSRFPRAPDGTIRAMASKFLEGIPKGRFNYEGTRPDDPNDVVRHEHRRELRGLYAMEAWLNQTDTKQGNTQEMFILAEASPEDEDERRFGYLRHNLIDFGSSLGSAAVRPQTPRHGSENELDLKAIGKRLITLGLYERPWQSVSDTAHPAAAGYYTADIFDPGDWRPNMPNAAFDNVDARDGYWGAKLVMSFTDAQLFAVVQAAEYSDPAAARYILDGLKARRDLTGRYWFARVSPLDDPRVEDRAVVVFDDLWIRHFGGSAEYRVRFRWDLPEPALQLEGEFREPRITLPLPAGSVPEAEDPRDRYGSLEVWKRQADGDWAPRPARFWLDWEDGSYRLIGARY
ncbi:MAG TPA: hypothetical protein VM737_06570 [Gemmatimonadota bacterium]|nr:hypothetical protein [Gemmatimonadota bacterium]